MLSSRPPRSPNYAGFRRRGIPLVHQLGVAGPFRRQGVATLLIDAAEKLARDRDIATLGITVGLFDEYGTAQRLYGRRLYPYGRGAYQGQLPLSKGMRVTIDDDPGHVAEQGSPQLIHQYRSAAEPDVSFGVRVFK